MNVTFDEGKLFYELYAALLSYVNRKLNVVTEQFSDSREYSATPPETRADGAARRKAIPTTVRANNKRFIAFFLKEGLHSRHFTTTAKPDFGMIQT